MSLLAKFAIFSIAIFVVVCGTALLFSTHYRVEVDWAGCWDATRIRGPVTADTPRTLSGCVDIWDHLQLEDTFN